MCSVELAFYGFQAAMAGYGMYSQQQAMNEQADYQTALAQQQADVMEMNQDMANRQAKDIEAQGETDAKNHMQKAAALKSEQMGRLAANGLSLSEGSPLSLLEDTEFMGKYDANTIRNNAERDAWGVRVQGVNYGAQADASRISGSMYQSQKSSPLTSALTGMVGSVSSNWGGITDATKGLGTNAASSGLKMKRGQTGVAKISDWSK